MVILLLSSISSSIFLLFPSPLHPCRCHHHLLLPLLLFLLLLFKSSNTLKKKKSSNTLVSCSLISFLEASWSISHSHISPSIKSLDFLLWKLHPSSLVLSIGLCYFRIPSCPQIIPLQHPSVSHGLQGGTSPPRAFKGMGSLHQCVICALVKGGF